MNGKPAGTRWLIFFEKLQAIVLVGEYMGWNFTVAKGGVLGSLLAMLVAGTTLTLID